MEGTRDEVRASGEVGALEGIRALLLLAFDLFAEPWEPASLSCSSVRSARGLL